MYKIEDVVNFIIEEELNVKHTGKIVSVCLSGNGEISYTIKDYKTGYYCEVKERHILKNKEEKKEMKKSDLKNRMVVEMRNGNRYMVVDNYLMRQGGYMLLSDYNEDLTIEQTFKVPISYNLKELDIMKIYGPYQTLEDMNNVFAMEIWERDETKEIKFSNDLDFAISVTDYLTAKKEHGDESAIIKFDLK